jgi:hypothetical protein
MLFGSRSQTGTVWKLRGIDWAEMMFGRAAIALAAVCAAAVIPASAHHSIGQYDLVHGTIIEGEVTAFQWENPHAHILLDMMGELNTMGKSDIEHWEIELEAPRLLRKLGWEKDTVRPGMRILVTGGRARNGSFHLRATQVELPGGQKLPALPVPEN